MEQVWDQRTNESELCAMAGLDKEELEQTADRSRQETEEERDLGKVTERERHEQEHRELQELEEEAERCLAWAAETFDNSDWDVLKCGAEDQEQVKLRMDPDLLAAATMDSMQGVQITEADLERLQIHARKVDGLRCPELADNRTLQVEFIQAMGEFAEAAAKNGHGYDWPIRVEAAKKSLHPGTVDTEVDPVEMMLLGVGDVPDELLKTHLRQQSFGVLVHLRQPRVRQRSPVLPSAKSYLREVWAQIWKDVSLGRTDIFGPSVLHLMDSAQIQCSPYARVPKTSYPLGHSPVFWGLLRSFQPLRCLVRCLRHCP